MKRSIISQAILSERIGLTTGAENPSRITEAETVEAPAEKLADMIPELLEANDALPGGRQGRW